MADTVGSLGEDGILAVLNRRFAITWPAGTVGPGDDAAVLSAPDARVVVSADTMNLNHHFRLVWPLGFCDSGFSTGWKLAAQNLSDINAMGAQPTALILSLAMPSHTPVRWVDRFASGIMAACHYLYPARDLTVAGGDLTAAETVSVAMTALGTLDGRAPALRVAKGPASENASENVSDKASKNEAVGQDVLMHRGAPGWAAAGLALLDTERDSLPATVDSATRRTAVRAIRAQLRPRPALEIGYRAARWASAMMDVSDGITRDAQRLAQANNAHAELDDEWVQRATHPLNGLAEMLETDPSEWIRAGGEDYGLLAVVPRDPEPLKQMQHLGFERIGYVTSAPDVSPRPHADGWDHFS